MGAGVPRPVQPKSHTQRIATAKPITDGIAASHLQRAAPAVSTRNPSHCGNSQNHKVKNAVPTRSEAAAVGQRSATGAEEVPEAGIELPPREIVNKKGAKSNGRTEDRENRKAETTAGPSTASLRDSGRDDGGTEDS